MNKQPFYHSVGIVFTATAEVNGDVIREMLEKELPEMFPGVIITESIDVEYCEAEAGSPGNLM